MRDFSPFRELSKRDHESAMHEVVRSLSTPTGWGELAPVLGILGGRQWRTPGGLIVAITVDEVVGAEWVHISVSRRSRTPSYEDLLLVRKALLGEERPAYQVFPKRQEYRSLPGATVLHLWQPLGDDPFPDPLGERAATVAP